MQVSKDNNIDKRLLFYWSKLYTSGIHQGEDYHKLHKSIVILIANFKIPKLKHIHKFHTKWHIREEEYSKILLTDTPKIHIIELPKLLNQLKNNNGIENNQLQFDLIFEKIGDKNMDNNEDKASQKAYEEKLILWPMFFMQPDFLTEEDLDKYDDIRKAKEELDKLRQNKKAQRLAELRMKYILEQNAIMDSALEEGFENGFEEGKKKSVLEIAKELLILNMPIKQISQITKLTEDEINSIE